MSPNNALPLLFAFLACAGNHGTDSGAEPSATAPKSQAHTVSTAAATPTPAPRKDDRDSLDRRLTAYASKDCGRVRLDGRNRQEVDSCVKSCFESHEHFHARYDQQGIDSVVARGVVSYENGFWIYDYDSMGAGEPGQFPGTFAYQCQKPKLVSEARGLRFVCLNEYEMW